MNTDTPPPCAGMSYLFDATDAHSHEAARAICATCPVIEACRERLTDARRHQMVAGPNGGPEGTWAGLLIKSKGAVS